MKKAVLILGDQLSIENPALQLAVEENLPVLMVETAAEAKAVWNHKARLVLFLSAMRHFKKSLESLQVDLHYYQLDQSQGLDLAAFAFDWLQKADLQELICTEPGEWRLEQALVDQSRQTGIQLCLLPDSHFMCSRSEFARYASKFKQLRMEYFYREMRKKFRVLMDGDAPEGGQWNFDAENRKAFPKTGPGNISPPAFFAPDEITQQVIAEVEQNFSDHPGVLTHFAWPVTREQALEALGVFIETRLGQFGDFQDAMWTKTPFGWHSLLASSINLHLLDPREVIAAAEKAYREGQADLAAVEGFIRQILGWREFIRGVYWLDMPGMREANFLAANQGLPKWFWSGETSMACLSDSIQQTLQYGYAHHIQRLMVIGNFATLAGLIPQQVEDWFLAVYVDAVEWVELPNVAGMALYANGGRFTSKPYVASGSYIKRMSNYCQGCKYDPAAKKGDKACPMTVLYWGFLERHESLLSANPRTSLMTRHLLKQSDEDRQLIQEEAKAVLNRLEEL